MTELLSGRAFADFPSAFKGAVLRPGDDGYDSARQIWNMRRRDDRPALIVQAADRDDVAVAAAYANSKSVPIAVRGGGHGIDGHAMPHQAIVLDLSKLKAITVDAERGHATIEAGVLLGEMDAATQRHGYVVPAGVVSDTGAVGLALGGGIGHLTRRFGATVDNLLSIEAVTADGRVVTASADSNPDLFWGMRGAGHNLAIATSLTFHAHEVGPVVMSGLIIYAADDAQKVFTGLDAVMAASPRELSVALIVLAAPPLPGLPNHIVGTPVLVALIIYTGDLAGYEPAMRGVRSLAVPLADLVQQSTWVEANSIVDPFEPAGRSQYLLGGYLPGINADMAKIALERIAAAPPSASPVPSCLITLPILGGALLDRPEDSTAFSRAGAEWLYEVSAHWEEPRDDDAYTGWVHDTESIFQRWASSNAYINLTGDRGPQWLRGAYGSQDKWSRIVALKRTWDPDNRLAHNKNVLDAAEPGES